MKDYTLADDQKKNRVASFIVAQFETHLRFNSMKELAIEFSLSNK